MKLLVTGGAGFIGSAVVRLAMAAGHEVVNLDALTYAACLDNVASVAGTPGYASSRPTSATGPTLARVFETHAPDAVMHLAAESHVDRSIDGPGAFIDTNVMGTYALLQAARTHWEAQGRPEDFRFHHVSTDEVFGSLGAEVQFTETTPYDPRSPYSASKAASDHLVRAWHHTYGLPVVLSNCSNNYGPFHFPEKLIPVVILNALAGRPIPIYGDGSNVRDWLYVEDHADALLCVLRTGALGESYNIGGENEARNMDLVRMICAILDRLRPAGAPLCRSDPFRQRPARSRPALCHRPQPHPRRAGLAAFGDTGTGPGADRAMVSRQRRLVARLQSRDGVGTRLGQG